MTENKTCNCTAENKLSGVGCDVVCCRYHGHDNYCHADKISVESQNAIRKSETFCSTFTPKASV